MSRSDIIREYYGRIDRADTTWVIALFATDAVYQRAETTYLGSSEIKRFFTEERKITGVHTVDEIFISNEGDIVVATGNFRGKGVAGDPRAVGFTDIWKFDCQGLVRLRQTFLAIGSDYVRA